MRRSVRFTGEVQELRLVDRTLGPFSPGDEAQIWEWDAEVMERHGLAAPAQRLSPQDVRKLTLLQERSSTPISLPPDFYGTAAATIRSMLARGDERAAEELRSALATMVEVRLPKLVILSLSPDAIPELPSEEVFLLNLLSGIIEEWIRKVTDVGEKIGGEVERDGGGTVSRHSGDEADIQK
jgi:hypothetical protein